MPRPQPCERQHWTPASDERTAVDSRGLTPAELRLTLAPAVDESSLGGSLYGWRKAAPLHPALKATAIRGKAIENNRAVVERIA